jgi:KDO2-lipid IV(A) lauroyltransferase
MTKAQATPLYHFLGPRYWLTWFLLGSIFLLNQLPYRIQVKVGSLIGRLYFYMGKRRRNIAEVNLAQCFPELSAVERKAILCEHFESLGIAVLETGLSWWGPAEKLKPLIHIEGLSHLLKAQENHQPVILLSAHFTTLEIGGRLLSLSVPFHVMYRQNGNLLFEEVMRRARKEHYEKAIPRNDVRGMIKSLQSARPVWYAPDQNYGGERSIFVPFFNVPTATITATSRLAKIGKAQVIPFFQTRLKDGRGYNIEILPPLADFPSADPTKDAIRINQLIESRIRKCPAQYLWVQRRFKARPPGKADYYQAVIRAHQNPIRYIASLLSR